MLKVTTGIDSARAAKYLREVLERAVIDELKDKTLANKIKNPVANPKRLNKWRDPVRKGVNKVFKLIPYCKEVEKP